MRVVLCHGRNNIPRFAHGSKRLLPLHIVWPVIGRYISHSPKMAPMRLRFRLPGITFLPILAAFLSHCGSAVYYVRPPDWSEPSRRDSAIALFAEALRGKTVFLDPGHGGDDRANRGPAGDVIEADVNLRVALRLRDYLKAAGANVLMSRETDQSVPLTARIQQANANNADVFLSIHHNAAENPATNYTATFYHAHPGAPGYKPSSHDLARYIQRDLAFVMGNPGSLATFDGTISDFLIHPNEGYAVLRSAKMTSVLIECAFFTSAYEEQRLKREEFNDIQAWGIFRGLGKYLRAGVPQLAYASPVFFAEKRPRITVEVKDKGEIKDESIRVWVDGKEEGFIYNAKSKRITVTPSDDLGAGYHRLSAQVRNSNENSSAPFELYFAVVAAPALLRSSVEPAILPPDDQTFSHIVVTAVDSAGKPLGDDIPIRFTTSAGRDTVLFTKQGVVRTIITPGTAPRVTFEASNGPVRTGGAVATSADALYTRGVVMSSDGKPVGGARIVLPGDKEALTNEQGEYIIAGVQTDGLEARITAPGYFMRTEALTRSRVQDPVLLAPVARGVLHGKTILLDLATPAAAPPETRVDVRTRTQLTALLEASGARVIIPSRETATRKAAADVLAAQKAAVYLQVGLNSGSNKYALKINGQQGAKTLSDIILKTLPVYVNAAPMPWVQRTNPNPDLEKLRHVVVLLPPPGSKSYEEGLSPYFAMNAAWALYGSILNAEGFKAKGSKLIEVTVTEKGTKTPAAFALVSLNGTVQCMTDAKGVARFRNVTVGEDDVRVVDADRYEIAGVKTELVP